MTSFWNSLRLFLWMTLITGVVYPLLITLIAQTTIKHKADGNLIVKNDATIGSQLLAQKFTNDKYFWPRPSFPDYDPMKSGGSNLGPTSKALKVTVEKRKAALAKANSVEDDKIPAELLYASASGLDPHITPAAAYFQIPRIIKARNFDEKSASEIKKLVDSMIENRDLHFLGTRRINVLMLNMALDNFNPPMADK